jgi:hypothetical protein
MAKQFGSQLDLQKIPVLGLVMQQAAAASPPSSPVNGQFWYDSTNNKAKVYENGAWVDIFSTAAAGGPAGGDLTGTYPNPTIAAGKVTSTAILDGTIALGDLAFTPLTSGSTAGGDLTGTYPNPTIGAGKVTSSHLQDGTVALVDLSNALIEAGIGAGSAPSGSPALRVLGFAAGDAMAGNSTLDVQATNNPLTGGLSLNNKRITSLADPTSAQDGATKNYVDSVAQGLDTKMSCKCATTASINAGGAPSGAATLDGIAVTTGDRVLVKDQSNPNNNGIYVANTAGAWTRATDMDTWAEVPGAFTFVEEGTTQNDTGWVCVSNQGGVLGTNGITWAQFSGAGSITAGLGLTRTANTLDVIGTANRIVANADSIDIDAAYAGQTSITTLGTVATGTWNATTIALNKGGTGATTAAAARTALGAVGKFAGDLPALSAGVESTLAHNLGTLDIVVSIRNTTNFEVVCQWRAVDTNTIGVTADVAYSAAALRAVVIG